MFYVEKELPLPLVEQVEAFFLREGRIISQDALSLLDRHGCAAGLSQDIVAFALRRDQIVPRHRLNRG